MFLGLQILTRASLWAGCLWHDVPSPLSLGPGGRQLDSSSLYSPTSLSAFKHIPSPGRCPLQSSLPMHEMIRSHHLSLRRRNKIESAVLGGEKEKHFSIEVRTPGWQMEARGKAGSSAAGGLFLRMTNLDGLPGMEGLLKTHEVPGQTGVVGSF